MKKNALLIAAALVWLAGLGFLAVGPAQPAAADWYGPGPGYEGYGPPPDGWGHERHGHGYGHDGPCGGRATYMIERMDRFMGHAMDFNDKQEAAWKDVVKTADTAREKVQETCKDRDAFTGTAPERLARVETMMSAGLEAVKEVRPKFDTFYATLTDRQKQRLDDMMDHRHHGGWH